MVLEMGLGLDETSEGFYLGELVVAVCMWGGGEEKGTTKTQSNLMLPLRIALTAISRLFQCLPCDLG